MLHMSFFLYYAIAIYIFTFMKYFSFSNKKFSIFLVFLLLLNIFVFKNPFIGAATILALIKIPGSFISSYFKDSSSILGSYLVLLYLMSVGGIIYFFYKITLSISLLLIIIPLLFLLKKENISIGFQKIQRSPLLHFIFAIDLSLLTFLFLKRTDALLVSPWEITSPLFFILFAVSTAGILYQYSKQKNIPIGIISTHLFLSFSVASIVYALGFGFDGFIHRATEQWILQNGFIEPKQPFYLGQYAIITMLSHLTTIPIFYIDTFFVPLLSSLILPISFEQLFKKRSSLQSGAVYSLLVPLLYFITLNLTTPHNLVILLTISAVCFLYSEKMTISWMIAITAVLTHPLPGFPLLLFTLFFHLAKKYNTKKIQNIFTMILFLCISLAPAAMFILQNIRSGFGFPNIINPFYKIDHFLELFQTPYWYLKDAGFMLDSLYFWQHILPVVAVLLGLYGLYTMKASLYPKITLAMFVGLWVGAWFLRSWIYFPNVATYEQGNYPLRLISASILYLLPFIAIGLQQMSKNLPKNKTVYYGGIFFLSLVLMVSLYFSYPQKNHKSRYPGYNVTKQDISTVQYIHNQENDLEYTVLSNPLVSIAALTKYSFAKHFNTKEGELFYYAIPTGGPLYQLYGDMLYKDQKRSTMIEAMDLMGTDKAYFVLNSYWGNSEKIKNGALATADSMHTISEGNNEVYIFTYYR